MTTPVTWDLSDLYVGVEDPKLTADLDRLDARAARFAEAYRGKVGQLSPPDFAAALVEYEAIQRDVQNPGAFAQLVFAADSLDPRTARSSSRSRNAKSPLVVSSSSSPSKS